MADFNPTVPQTARRLPAWISAVVVLQSVTLLAVVAARPSAPAAGAAQLGESRAAQDDGRPVLPNAAEQRAQQSRLLGQIHDELVKMNQKLDRVNDQLKAQQDQQPARQPQP